jgi:hypothetical protein
MARSRRRPAEPEPEPEPEKKGYSIRFSEHMHAAMKRLAKKHRRSLADEIRCVFDEYLKQYAEYLGQHGLWPPPEE